MIRHSLCLASLLALFSFAACGGGDDDGQLPTADADTTDADPAAPDADTSLPAMHICGPGLHAPECITATEICIIIPGASKANDQGECIALPDGCVDDSRDCADCGAACPDGRVCIDRDEPNYVTCNTAP